MRRRALPSICLGVFLSLLSRAAGAAYPGQDPNWPCQQRLVPTLSASALWNGPPLIGSPDWRTEPKVATLVGRIASRNVTIQEGQAAIAAFVEELTAHKRARLIPLAFAGLLEETNRQRDALIDRLKDLGERQRKLADLVTRTSAALDSARVSAQGGDTAARDELEQRNSFLIRAFEEGQRTLRYACEAPVQLEARLGAYARSLESALP